MKHPVDVLKKRKEELLRSIQSNEEELHHNEEYTRRCKERLAEFRQSIIEVDEALHVIGSCQQPQPGEPVMDNPFIWLGQAGVMKLEDRICNGILFECLTCEQREVVLASDKKQDGRKCKECGQHAVPIGYVGIDFASRTDYTAKK